MKKVKSSNQDLYQNLKILQIIFSKGANCFVFFIGVAPERHFIASDCGFIKLGGWFVDFPSLATMLRRII